VKFSMANISVAIILCKQTHDSFDDASVTMADICNGYVWRDCPDCNGTGIFIMPEGHGKSCVVCKGSGRLPVPLN
jgi:DnaJ-class molecular chaperone